MAKQPFTTWALTASLRTTQPYVYQSFSWCRLMPRHPLPPKNNPCLYFWSTICWDRGCDCNVRWLIVLGYGAGDMYSQELRTKCLLQIQLYSHPFDNAPDSHYTHLLTADLIVEVHEHGVLLVVWLFRRVEHKVTFTPLYIETWNVVVGVVDQSRWSRKRSLLHVNVAVFTLAAAIRRISSLDSFDIQPLIFTWHQCRRV